MGRTATERVTALMSGKTASCALNGEVTHGRLVGWCSVDGQDVGEVLIRESFCGRCERYDPELR